MTEQEFRLQADRALEGVQQALLPLADQEGFEVELQNGVLQVDLRGSHLPQNSSSVQTRRSVRSGCPRCHAATSSRGRMTPPHSHWMVRRSRLSSSASRASICRRRPRSSFKSLAHRWLAAKPAGGRARLCHITQNPPITCIVRTSDRR